MKKIIGYALAGTMALTLGMATRHLLSQNDRPAPQTASAPPPVIALQPSDTLPSLPLPVSWINDPAQLDTLGLGEAAAHVQRRLLIQMFDELAQSDPLAARDLLEQDSSIDPRTQDALLQALAHHWSLADPFAARDWLLARPPSSATHAFDQALSTALTHLAKVAPADAMNDVSRIMDTDARFATLSDIATHWVEQDHANAFAWFESLQDSNLSDESLDDCYLSMMRAFTKTNPAQAANLVGSLESTDLKSALIPHASNAFAQQDLESALRWAQALEDQSSRQVALKEIILAQGESQPQTIVRQLLEQPTKSDSSLLALAFEAFVIKDESAALATLEQVPSTALETVAAAITYGKLSNNQQAVPAWIDSLPPGPMRDGAAGVLALESIASDSLAALDWAKKIDNPSKRNGYIREIALNAPVERLPEVASALPKANLSPEQSSVIQKLITDRIQETTTTR